MTQDHLTRLSATARSLLVQSGALQSTENGEQITPDAVREALERQIIAASQNGESGVATPAEDRSAVVEDIVTHAQRALDKVGAGESASNLADHEVSALQAIVLVIGRPAMEYKAGQVQMPLATADNEAWGAWLSARRADIDSVSSSVGLLSIGELGGAQEPLGTAWRLGADLAVTNRHVAERIVEDSQRPRSAWRLDAAKHTTVDFGIAKAANTPLYGRVQSLVYCATEDDLDIAILRVAPVGGDLPAALELEWNDVEIGRTIASDDAPAWFLGEKVYVVGHPYRLLLSQAIRSVFGVPDGRKRCAPGLVTSLSAGSLRFEHDCSTLGGNSGSCVFSHRNNRVVGLHFGARDTNVRTAIGSANLAIAFARLSDGQLTKMLREGHA